MSQEETINTLKDDFGSSPEPVAEEQEAVEQAADNTLDADTPAGAKNTDKAAEEKTVQQDDDAAKAKADEEFQTRFDKHPRFQQLIKERDELKGQVSSISEKLETLMRQKPEPAQGADFDARIAALKRERDDGNIDLDEYEAKRDQIREEQIQAKVDQQLSGARQHEELQKSKAQLLSENPFIETILNENGADLKRIMDGNHLHDELSAALMLHIDSLEKGKQAEIDDAVAKAVKEAEEKFIKNSEAKRTARALGSGPKATPDEHAELKNTKERGGVTNVLAERLKRMRSQ